MSISKPSIYKKNQLYDEICNKPTKPAISKLKMYVTLEMIFLQNTYSYIVSMHSKLMNSYLLQNPRVKFLLLKI